MEKTEDLFKMQHTKTFLIGASVPRYNAALGDCQHGAFRKPLLAQSDVLQYLTGSNASIYLDLNQSVVALAGGLVPFSLEIIWKML